MALSLLGGADAGKLQPQEPAALQLVCLEPCSLNLLCLALQRQQRYQIRERRPACSLHWHISLCAIIPACDMVSCLPEADALPLPSAAALKVLVERADPAAMQP